QFWSVVSCQLSVVRCQLPALGRTRGDPQRTTDNGPRTFSLCPTSQLKSNSQPATTRYPSTGRTATPALIRTATFATAARALHAVKEGGRIDSHRIFCRC